MDKRRNQIQLLGFFILNGYLKGFLTGRIYTGSSKSLCIPVLNCYSCPGAVGSCPIGSLQGVSGGFGYRFSYYVVGLLGLFGIMAGRLYCGYLCPFGFLQDLVYKIRSKKLKYPKVIKILQYIKYIVLIAIILIPLVSTSQILDPYFCKYICPSGTIFAGIPLVLTNPSLQDAIGLLFSWKIGLSALVIIASIFYFRPFCRILCPLGAFYGLLNPISMYKLNIKDSCISCGKCESVCGYSIYTKETPNHRECVRCDKCMDACPVRAIERKYK